MRPRKVIDYSEAALASAASQGGAVSPPVPGAMEQRDDDADLAHAGATNSDDDDDDGFHRQRVGRKKTKIQALKTGDVGGKTSDFSLRANTGVSVRGKAPRSGPLGAFFAAAMLVALVRVFVYAVPSYSLLPLPP